LLRAMEHGSDGFDGSVRMKEISAAVSLLLIRDNP
jgi:hypothetical protein